MTDEHEPDSRSQRLINHLATRLYHAVVAARREVMHEEHAARTQATTNWLEAMEPELGVHVSKVLDDLGELEDLPPGLKGLFDLVRGPEHQFDAILQIICLIGAAFATVMQGGAIEATKTLNLLKSNYTDLPLSPADAADGVMRGILDMDSGKSEAALSQLDNHRFEQLVELTGEPPGPVDMLSLWRRDLMTEAELDEAILYSRIKDKYIPFVKLLAHSYMSPADVIELCVKGLVDEPTAATMFGVAGGLPDQFDILFKGAGNAIGNEASLNLYNHGLATKDEVYEVFGRSRMNPIFYDLAFKLRHKFLGVIQIESMIKAGTVSTADATAWLIADGYEADQVAAFVGAHATGTGSTSKSESEAIVVASYQHKVLTEKEATAELAKIGYTAEAASLILQLSDAKASQAELAAALAAVRTAYVEGKINTATATTSLDKLGFSAQARQQYLQAWEVEKTAKVKTLTVAEVGWLAQHSKITYEQASTRWQEMGYSANDAGLLALRYGYTPPPGTAPIPGL